MEEIRFVCQLGCEACAIYSILLLSTFKEALNDSKPVRSCVSVCYACK